MNLPIPPSGLPGVGAPARLTVRTPADMIAAVPYLLGFHPADSLVAVGFNDSKGVGAIRIDLPDPGDPSEDRTCGSQIVAVLRNRGFRKAILIGFGSERAVEPLGRRLIQDAAEAGLRIVDLLRVQDGRWWSLNCPNPACCPPEGVPFDPSALPVSASAVFQGLVAEASRDDLALRLAPVVAELPAMREAVACAERRHHDTRHIDPRRTPKETITGFLRGLDDLRARTRDGGPKATVEEIAELSVLLGNLRLRDEAWIRIDTDDPGVDVALWTDVLRRTTPELAAAPASLLAFAAYMTGKGALANLALDRAERANPNYALAALVRVTISQGVPLSRLRDFVNREDVDRAYGAPSEST